LAHYRGRRGRAFSDVKLWGITKMATVPIYYYILSTIGPEFADNIDQDMVPELNDAVPFLSTKYNDIVRVIGFYLVMREFFPDARPEFRRAVVRQSLAIAFKE
jgi:hypothetical protein